MKYGQGRGEGPVDVRADIRVGVRGGGGRVRAILPIPRGGGGRSKEAADAEERGEWARGRRVDSLDALVQGREIAADVARDQNLDRIRVGHRVGTVRRPRAVAKGERQSSEPPTVRRRGLVPCFCFPKLSNTK